jgi:hypothetical protein
MNRAVLAFIAIAYALSIALSLVVGLTGGYQSRFVGLGVSALLFPTIAVLIVEFETFNVKEYSCRRSLHACGSTARPRRP